MKNFPETDKVRNEDVFREYILRNNLRIITIIVGKIERKSGRGGRASTQFMK